ncbi:MAG: SHOCT domain-containing protein [Gammaproteobacteria bacterium]
MQLSKTKIVALLFIFPAFFSCSVFAGKNTIWQANKNEFFKFTDQDTSSFGLNDHPVELQSKQISEILGAIKIQDTSDPDMENEFKTVFPDKQIILLGKYIAKGLKNAKANKDIIFAMERSAGRDYGLTPDRYFVAGRVFYKDNKLNIIIGNYDMPRDTAFEAAYDPTHTGIVRYNFNHGKRSKASRFKRAITHVKGIQNKQVKNNQRNDWLVIDVDGASEAIAHDIKIRKQEETAQKRKELRELLGSEEVDRHAETIRREAIITPPETTTRSDSLEDRLTKLKGLRNKDLITEEEYAQKRKQLLDEL